jgi:RNA polymerase sigma-70 factor (ECF subfamily)
MIDTKKFGEFSRLSFVDTTTQGYTPTDDSKPHLVLDTTWSQKIETGSNTSMGANPAAGNREIDQELVERAQRGDKRAFGMLVEKYQRKLGRLLSRLIRDQAEVEDVVQESFIKAYRALPNFRGESAFYTWLYRIGINTAKNYLVSMGRRPQISNDVEIEDAENFEDANELRTMETPETELMTKEIAQTVNDTVAALPEELRTAITLREIEGLSYEEIATLMNCPIGTVRSRIFRASETIAEQLRPLLNTPENKRW